MRYIILTLALATAFGCNDAATPVSQSNVNTATGAKTEKSQTAIAHSNEKQTPNPAAQTEEKGKWTASGDPIDTKELDAAVMAAEKAFAAKSSDPAAKKALSDAFYKRAVALTEARQYASAIGDYRRTLKHDPTNADAKEWVDKITMIYDSLRKAAPKEGEEPPPLPFKKT